jgi:hypothetical protein
MFTTLTLLQSIRHFLECASTRTSHTSMDLTLKIRHIKYTPHISPPTSVTAQQTSSDRAGPSHGPSSRTDLHPPPRTPLSTSSSFGPRYMDRSARTTAAHHSDFSAAALSFCASIWRTGVCSSSITHSAFSAQNPCSGSAACFPRRRFLRQRHNARTCRRQRSQWTLGGRGHAQHTRAPEWQMRVRFVHWRPSRLPSIDGTVDNLDLACAFDQAVGDEGAHWDGTVLPLDMHPHGRT